MMATLFTCAVISVVSSTRTFATPVKTSLGGGIGCGLVCRTQLKICVYQCSRIVCLAQYLHCVCAAP